MLVSGLNLNLNRFESGVVNKNREQQQTQVIRMDVEEGEISDSASVEEISAEDFVVKTPTEPAASSSNSNSNNNISNRDNKVLDSDSDSNQQKVWTMRDLYKYHNEYKGNYTSGLYNIAWAQAVQNKPLDEILVMEFKNTDKRSSENHSTRSEARNNSSDDGRGSVKEAKEVKDKVIIDVSGDEGDDMKMEEVVVVEKEEGELEEGEIDFDSDDVEIVGEEGGLGKKNESDVSKSPGENDLKEDSDLDNEQLKLIREGIENVTVDNAEKSYDGVCSRLQNSLDKLQEVIMEIHSPRMDTLVQLSFSAIQTVNTVFCAMDPNQKEQNRDMLSRVLVHVTNQEPPIFSSEQMKELEVMISSLNSAVISSGTEDSDAKNEVQVTEREDQMESVSSAQNAVDDSSYSTAVKSLDQYQFQMLLDPLRIGLATSKTRAASLPLLDLHKDHDEDNLPSPTREMPVCLPIDKLPTFGAGILKPEVLVPRGVPVTEKALLHSYETDAHKAVSFYQQKFGRSSSFMSNRLPSPTPSDEGDDEDGDIGGEISSSSNVQNIHALDAPTLGGQLVSSQHLVNINGAQGLMDPRKTGPVSSGYNSVFRVPGRSRDPRLLRLANSDAGALDLNQGPFAMVNNDGKVDSLGGISSSRKQKLPEEPAMDGPAAKRQRNEFNSSTPMDFQNTSGTGGWLEDRGTVGLQLTNRYTAEKNAGSDVRKLEMPRISSGSNSSMPMDFRYTPGNGVWLEDGGTVGLQSTNRNSGVENAVSDVRKLEMPRISSCINSSTPKDFQTTSGTGGWLEDRGTIGLHLTNRSPAVENARNDVRKLEMPRMSSGVNSSIPDVINNENEHLPLTGANTTASLHSLLKDIAVNPALWMNIIKMEQQKSVDPAKSITQPPLLNSFHGAVLVANVAPPKPSVVGQRSTGMLQTTQTAPMDESGKIRMKPRDPRRVLQSNSVQKPGILASDLPKTTTSNDLGKSNLNPQNQGDQLDKISILSHSIPPPDITQQFTSNLKNIGSIMSVSQTSTIPPAVPQTPVSLPLQVHPNLQIPVSQQLQVHPSPENPVSQPVQVHPSWVDSKGVPSQPGQLQIGTKSASEEVASDPQLQNTWGDVEHLFDGFDDQQRAAIQRERVRRIEEQKKMFASRKLCLVLDLDHTLLNSAKFLEVDPGHDELLRKKEEQDREKPYRHLYRFPHMGMWTKLRPGIWNFLEKASKLYELHLYTMGNKLYATEMAKVLDPKGVLFAGRVISKGDEGDSIDGDERAPKSKDLEGVLGMESDVVIIDDSIRVWPHNKLNLIVVERYIYFPCSRRQFGLAGPSLLEIDHDERPEDGTLACCLGVIEKIHQNFFSHRSLDEADVRNILASEQRKILAGCRILFSRVFPVGEANPHLHPLWQTAEQFGSVCTNQIDEQVTHVVAQSLGTDKVNWALSTGRFVVHPGWVEASALLYRRASEHDFAVKI